MDQVGVAIQTMSEIDISTPGHADEEALPPVKFSRLGLERRVLGHITDEVDDDAVGARNTLAALTYSLMRDPNTTRPRGGLAEALPVDVSIEEITTNVLSKLDALTDAGLVEAREDGSYTVTDAGHVELNS